jgi:hypothetical protein
MLGAPGRRQGSLSGGARGAPAALRLGSEVALREVELAELCPGKEAGPAELRPGHRRRIPRRRLPSVLDQA